MQEADVLQNECVFSGVETLKKLESASLEEAIQTQEGVRVLEER